MGSKGSVINVSPISLFWILAGAAIVIYLWGKREVNATVELLTPEVVFHKDPNSVVGTTK